VRVRTLVSIAGMCSICGNQPDVPFLRLLVSYNRYNVVVL